MNGNDPAIPRPNAATDVGAGATTTGHRIEGVRPCLQCGHDLNGQPILKEPDLGLLLARCPECGRAAALVEHPTLGVWGRRLGVLVLTTIVGVVVILSIVTAASMFGVTMGMFQELSSDARVTLGQMIPENTWQVTEDWWRANGTAARPVMWRAVDPWNPDVMTLGIIFLLLSLIAGVLWSGVLLGVRWRWLPLFGIGIGVSSWALTWLPVLTTRNAQGLSFPVSTRDFVMREMLPLVGLGVTAFLTLSLVVGLLVGRPILRAAVGFILPARSRRMLRPLWDVDGLDPEVPVN